jgi:hypothetical protein
MALIAVWLVLAGDPRSVDDLASELGAEVLQLGDPPIVRVDLLDSRTAAYDQDGRNLFAYHQPAKPAQSVKISKPLETSPTLTSLQPTSHTQPVLSTRPGPAFGYIGFLGPKDDLLAVFDRGADVFVAQLGDVVDGSFELLAFQYEAVLLGYVGGKHKGETVRLRQTPS